MGGRGGGEGGGRGGGSGGGEEVGRGEGGVLTNQHRQRTRRLLPPPIGGSRVRSTAVAPGEPHGAAVFSATWSLEGKTTSHGSDSDG